MQAVQTSQQAQANNLDSAVTSTVLNQDFKIAKSLANTKEHWRLIAIAEGHTPPQPVIVANSQPFVSRADECKQAKYNFEYVSRNSWRDRNLVAAKKSIMYAACGVPESASNSPIFVGQRFGDFQFGCLFYPYAAAPYYAPHHTLPNHINHNYPYENVHYYGQNRSSHDHFQNGFSLNYRTRNFGISTVGFSSGGFSVR